MPALSLDWEAANSAILACALARSDSSFSTRPIRLEIRIAPASAAITSVVSAKIPATRFSVARKSCICLLAINLGYSEPTTHLHIPDSEAKIISHLNSCDCRGGRDD